MMTPMQAFEAIALPQNVALLKPRIEALEKARASVTDKQRVAFMQKAANDPDLASAQAAANIERIEVYTYPQTWATSFFEMKPLAHDEQPFILTTKRDRGLRANWLGQNGGIVRQTFAATTTINLQMKRVSSDEFEYPVLDLDWGRLTMRDQELRRAERSLAFKIDADCKAALDASYLASGLRLALNLDPHIVAANIPDKNYFDLSAVAPVGHLGQEKLKRILQYFDMLSSDVLDPDANDGFGAGPIVPVNIFMSGLQKRDIYDFADLVALIAGSSGPDAPQETVTHQTREEIFRTGKLMNAWGKPINFVTKNTLASGRLYISTNRPVGWMYDKADFQTSGVLPQSESQRRGNRESVVASRVYQLYVPAYRAANFVVVDL
jgi:hypothetical protein